MNDDYKNPIKSRVSNYDKIPSEIWQAKGLTMYDTLVYIYLCTWTKCYPSYSQIARATKMSSKSVQRAVERLQKMNMIRYTPGGMKGAMKRANFYQILDPSQWADGGLIDHGPTDHGQTVHGTVDSQSTYGGPTDQPLITSSSNSRTPIKDSGVVVQAPTPAVPETIVLPENYGCMTDSDWEYRMKENPLPEPITPEEHEAIARRALEIVSPLAEDNARKKIWGQK